MGRAEIKKIKEHIEGIENRLTDTPTLNDMRVLESEVEQWHDCAERLGLLEMDHPCMTVQDLKERITVAEERLDEYQQGLIAREMATKEAYDKLKERVAKIEQMHDLSDLGHPLPDDLPLVGDTKESREGGITRTITEAFADMEGKPSAEEPRKGQQCPDCGHQVDGRGRTWCPRCKEGRLFDIVFEYPPEEPEEGWCAHPDNYCGECNLECNFFDADTDRTDDGDCRWHRAARPPAGRDDRMHFEPDPEADPDPDHCECGDPKCPDYIPPEEPREGE